jgi:hypothetical protein
VKEWWRTILLCPFCERFLLINDGELQEVAYDRVRAWTGREWQVLSREISVHITDCKEHNEKENSESRLRETSEGEHAGMGPTWMSAPWLKSKMCWNAEIETGLTQTIRIRASSASEGEID